MTGNKKRVAVVDNSKLLSQADPAIRDENVEYYLWELDELQKKFQTFADALEQSISNSSSEQMEFQLES